jgi:alpha-tubulin suppressor-like RCC1 family protein
LRLLATVGGIAILGSTVVALPASARTIIPRPLISGLQASPSTIATYYGETTISATVTNATSCTLTAIPPVLSGTGTFDCSGGAFSQNVAFPVNTSVRRNAAYRLILTAAGSSAVVKKKAVRVLVQPGTGGVGGVPPGGATLSGVASVTGEGGGSSCAILQTSGVDCWGRGYDGQLGNGIFYRNPLEGSAIPVQVEGVGGTGALSGVSSVTSDGVGYNFCAVLTSSGVDCWGEGYYGELGNGTIDESIPFGSATPVQVIGVDGTGILSGVESLTSTTTSTYCALLSSGGVDCWGWGKEGELGNGTFYTTSPYSNGTPVAVGGVGGSGSLSGVQSLATDDLGYCALLDSGGVDCWGFGNEGQLGNGTFYTTGTEGSATPVPVQGVGGSGTLSGVESLTGSNQGYCAVLDSGGVDCWGNGYGGQLGNGTFYTTGTEGSATPVQVEGVGGSGTLNGVLSLSGVHETWCAVLDSGGVDCWGYDSWGDLGNGSFNESATPVQVEAVGGIGTLNGVTFLTVGAGNVCALLNSGGVDCWGYNQDGELGNGKFRPERHPRPG